MIFVGFGFLMVFLKCHSWTSVGFNFLIAAWVIQICVLCTGFWYQVMSYHNYHDPNYDHFHYIDIDIIQLIMADFCAAAVLITFGVVLGKIGFFQLWVLATIEVIFYCLNEAILSQIFQIVDIGGSIIIHTFGAVFGIAASFFFQPAEAIRNK